MSDADPRPSQKQIEEGVWVCQHCGCINDPDDFRCWNCNRDNDNTALPEARDE